MNTRTITPTPRLSKMLGELGENIRLARLRRRLTAEQVSERAGISRTTLWQIENGSPYGNHGGLCAGTLCAQFRKRNYGTGKKR